ncbi:hypothetical protein SBA3_410041 [Candidatus Sulfopaludibacter sp. SbA3]|nr:hypothetical protein SBA3_410041 [Candidatus Sulfopaludibacter sp. SbA3]
MCGCDLDVPSTLDKFSKTRIIFPPLLCGAIALRHNTLADFARSGFPHCFYKGGFCVWQSIRVVRHPLLANTQMSRECYSIRQQPRLHFSHGNPEKQIGVARFP